MKPFIKHGIGVGIVNGLWSLAGIRFPLSPGVRTVGGLLTVFILVSGIWLSMREVRRRNGGVLVYGQAIKTGVLVACIAGVIVALIAWWYGSGMQVAQVLIRQVVAGSIASFILATFVKTKD